MLFFCGLTRHCLYEVKGFGGVISEKEIYQFLLHEVPSAKSDSSLMELLGQKKRWEIFAPRREEKNLFRLKKIWVLI